MPDSKILDILQQENTPASTRVTAVCADISNRHKDRVMGFLYYGSSLRDIDNPEKMLDFYVIVDSYRKTHKNPVRAALNALIPPAVYYHEMLHEDGVLTTCKYSIISIGAFEKKTGPKALLSLIWGRFSQPCNLLFPVNDQAAERIMNARIGAVKHMANQTYPLAVSPISAEKFWAKGFHESYKTELRPESSEARSEEIVLRYTDRYTAIMKALYGAQHADGLFNIPESTAAQTRTAKRKWFFRRLLGKPMTAIRVINSAFTFDGGLDYVLRKLKNHSGVTMAVTPSQRRHPILWSPILGWKLWRKGAFR